MAGPHIDPRDTHLYPYIVIYIRARYIYIVYARECVIDRMAGPHIDPRDTHLYPYIVIYIRARYIYI